MKIMISRWFLLMVLLSTVGMAMALEEAARVSNDALPKAVVPRVKAPVTLDGKIDEEFWKKAVVLSFSNNDGQGTPRESTTVRLAYDEKNLYIAWDCRDSDILATYTQRDSKFWEEEVAEFFVTSGPLNQYFELQWNPLGGVFDAIIRNRLDEKGLSRGIQGDWDFTAEGMESSVSVDGTVQNSSDTDKGWVVEVEVPFAALNQAVPKPGDTWRANFYRFNRAKDRKEEHYSWSPTRLPSFHEPSRFGTLEFGS